MPPSATQVCSAAVVQLQEVWGRLTVGTTACTGRTCLELHHSQPWEAPGGIWEKFGSDHPNLAGQAAAGLLPLLICRQFPRQEAFCLLNPCAEWLLPANPHLPVQKWWQLQELKAVSFWRNKWSTNNSFFKKSNKTTIYGKTTCLKGNHWGCLICESNPT